MAQELLGSAAAPSRDTTARQTFSPSRASATGNAAARSTAGMTHRQRLDARRIDVAAAADDHVLLTPGDAQVAVVVEPAEIAGHEPALAH